MRQNHTVKRQFFGFIYAFLLVAGVLAGTVAAQDNRGSMAGNWSGSFQTPGPSGLLEIALTDTENKWSGEVRIEVSADKFLTKTARNIKIEGEKISFMIELMGAEVTFSGELKNGKLTGSLEAIEDGKTVGLGSWEMARSPK